MGNKLDSNFFLKKLLSEPFNEVLLLLVFITVDFFSEHFDADIP